MIHFNISSSTVLSWLDTAVTVKALWHPWDSCPHPQTHIESSLYFQDICKYKDYLSWFIILYVASGQTDDESVPHWIYGSLISSHPSFKWRFLKKESWLSYTRLSLSCFLNIRLISSATAEVIPNCFMTHLDFLPLIIPPSCPWLAGLFHTAVMWDS